MKVRDVMNEDVKSLTVPGNRDEAIEIIKELKVSALPVLKGKSGDFVGILRLRSLFEDPDENQLGMLVNRDVITITSDQPLGEAAELMVKNRVRRLPVVKKNKLEGMLTIDNILYEAIAGRMEDVNVSEIMHNSVTPLWEGTPLKVALEILNMSGERALPVLNDEGELVGMIGDEDIISNGEVRMEEKREIMGGKSEMKKWTGDNEDRVYITKRILEPSDKKVAEVMATDLITVSKRTSVGRAAALMKENNLNQLPVLSGSDLIGMISDEDLLKTLTR